MHLNLTRALYHSALLLTIAFHGVVEATVDAALHTVDLGYIKYQGVVNAKTGNTLFLGMRYANIRKIHGPRFSQTVRSVKSRPARPLSRVVEEYRTLSRLDN
jgi:hypothetical protein